MLSGLPQGYFHSIQHIPTRALGLGWARPLAGACPLCVLGPGLELGAEDLGAMFLALLLRIRIAHGFYSDLLFQGTESGKETSIQTWQMKYNPGLMK